MVIYFCFPYRGLGGVSLLFLRVAEHLQRNGLAQCHLVDYADGFMARNRGDSGVALDEYKDDGEFVRIPGGAVAVFQSMTPWSIFPRLIIDRNTRILFWNCYPFNLIPMLPGLRRQMQHSERLSRLLMSTLLRGYRSKMRSLVALLLSNRSLVFMDSANVLTTERYLGIRIRDPYLVPIPAPSDIANSNEVVSRDLSQELRVVWVGRLVDFKFYALHRALIELNRLAPSSAVSITITIIGSGNYYERLVKESHSLGNVSVQFADEISPRDLNRYVLRAADLVIAMGTSALECARLGVPTLLLDIAHAPLSADYLFTWIHERKGYTLGDVVSLEHFAAGNDSLSQRLRELRENFAGVSEMCRLHAQRHHDLAYVAKKFSQALSFASCTYGDLQDAGLLSRGVIYSMFVKLRRQMESL